MHGDHDETNDDQRKNRNDLDQREPEFCFTKRLHGHRVQGEQQDCRNDNRDPRGRLWPPESDVSGDGDHVGDAGDDPAHPVRPAGDEPGPGPDEVAGDVSERVIARVRQK